jgi:hypothetical protein
MARSRDTTTLPVRNYTYRRLLLNPVETEKPQEGGVFTIHTREQSGQIHRFNDYSGGSGVARRRTDSVRAVAAAVTVWRRCGGGAAAVRRR